MNILSKRIAVGLLSGVVLLAGSTAAYTVQAASQEGQQVSAVHNQKPPKPTSRDFFPTRSHPACTAPRVNPPPKPWTSTARTLTRCPQGG